MLSCDTSKTLLFLVVALSSIQLMLCLSEIEVYRLIAYEEQSATFGSKVASFNLVATHFTSDVLRKLALIHLSNLSEDNLNAILNKKPAGILIIIPRDVAGIEQDQAWRNATGFLLSRNIIVAVYLCWEYPAIMDIYNRLEAQNGTKGDDKSFQFIVNTDEPKLLNNVVLEDFYGYLEDPNILYAERKSNTPTILVAASYDSYSVFPDLRVGINEKSTGAVALLHMMQELSKVHAQYSKIKYNIVFYLTSTGSLNFESLNSWVSKPENAKIVSNLVYAIIVDSIGRTNSLYVEIYNPDQISLSLEILKSLNQTLYNYEIPYKLITDQSNIVPNLKVPIFRIFDNKGPLGGHERSLVDFYDFNLDVFKKNMLFFTEFVVGFLYNHTRDYRLTTSDSNINTEFLTALTELFEDTSRFYTQIVRDSPINKEIAKIFSTYSKNSNKYQYTYVKQKFYTHKPAKLHITRKQSPYIDLYIFSGVAGWLTILYVLFTYLNIGQRSENIKQKQR